MMKSFLLTTIALLLGLPTFAQTQTQTNCTANGDQINCTSTDNSASNAAAAQQQKDFDASMNKFGTALGTALAQKRAEKNLYNQIGNNLDYCGGHPDADVLDPNNVERSCDWFVQRSRMICVSHPKESFCKHIPAASSMSSTSVTAPSARAPDQSTLDAMFSADRAKDYCSQHPNDNYYYPAPRPSVPCKDILASPSAPSTTAPVAAPPAPDQSAFNAMTPAEKANDYCSRNPNSTWWVNAEQRYVPCKEILAAPSPATPVSSVSPASDPAAQASAPAPLTPEQRDAISYCKRNPTATITWNDGTVSSCSSVLGPQ